MVVQMTLDSFCLIILFPLGPSCMQGDFSSFAYIAVRAWMWSVSFFETYTVRIISSCCRDFHMLLQQASPFFDLYSDAVIVKELHVALLYTHRAREPIKFDILPPSLKWSVEH